MWIILLRFLFSDYTDTESSLSTGTSYKRNNLIESFMVVMNGQWTACSLSYITTAKTGSVRGTDIIIWMTDCSHKSREHTGSCATPGHISQVINPVKSRCFWMFFFYRFFFLQLVLPMHQYWVHLFQNSQHGTDRQLGTTVNIAPTMQYSTITLAKGVPQCCHS